MKKRTVELIIAIGLELLDWLSIILSEKRRSKTNDSERASKEKRQS